MNNLESLIGRNEVITKVFLELTDVTDDYYKELQSVHNRFVTRKSRLAAL